MAFLSFTAGGLLAMGGGLLHFRSGLLHFRSVLSVSSFLVFAAVIFLLISRVLVSLTLPSVGLGFLRWTVSLPLSPLLPLRMGAVVLVSWVSVDLAVSVPSRLFSSCRPFCSGGNFGTCFFIYLFFYLYIYIFYRMVSVFFPHFCTGLLLRGCYMWGNLLDGNRQYPPYGLHILYRHSSFNLSSYAVV